MTTNEIIVEKSNLDALSKALFSGPVRAADIKVMPGSSDKHSEEELASELLKSLQRVGIVRDYCLHDIN